MDAATDPLFPASTALSADVEELRKYVMGALVAHGGVTAPKSLRARVRQFLAALTTLGVALDADADCGPGIVCGDAALTFFDQSALALRHELLRTDDAQAATGVYWRTKCISITTARIVEAAESVLRSNAVVFSAMPSDALAPSDLLPICSKLRAQVDAAPLLDALIETLRAEPRDEGAVAALFESACREVYTAYTTLDGGRLCITDRLVGIIGRALRKTPP